ncbi:DNA-3-methyladenine glycosylase [Prochlorococcus marinus]|uniref:Putative 3-methyladenine DNA glycosylase n=1 Tax=Prochlorococcus marinus (strain MIT 9211) TaxID=93059 RepID=A9BDK1_PROM4|nr:possible Methylpurine-DNA glycosylase (MPG) [Prochlorococcus marinus str. MIT 9211]
MAPDLIGCLLIKQQPNHKPLWGVIVETEAYSESEPACHGYKKRTPKNETLFGPPGRFYIYLCYGMYYCVNVVTDKANWANGVLLRSIALPNEDERIASGPGLLAKRFGFNLEHDKYLITAEKMFWLAESTSAIKMKEVINTTRVGVSKAKDLPWRWYLQNSRSVSKRAKGDRCPPISQAWKPTLKES